MIQIIKGTFGYYNGRKVIPITEADGPQKFDDELEARLVKEGVAKYIGELGETAEQPAPAPGDDADEPASTNTAAGEAPEYNEAAASYFVKNGEGWRDAWNFVDTALRLIENAEYLGDLRVIKEKGITFGPVAEQDAVPDFYPYWFAWAEFSVEETLTRNPKSYQHLL